VNHVISTAIIGCKTVFVAFGAPCDGGLATETCRGDMKTNIYLIIVCALFGLS
jgi:hypothetical protein